MAQQRWVRLAFSDRFPLGARTIADRCGWRVREEADALLVCTDENYTGTAPRLLTPERIADARTVDELAAFDGVRGSAPQDGLLGDDLRRRVAEDLQHRIEAGQLPDILSGLQLNILSAPDAQLPHVVRDALQTRPDAVARRIDLEHPAGASGWSRGSSGDSRRSALLAATDTPEILARDGETFQGFPAANALVQPPRRARPPGSGASRSRWQSSERPNLRERRVCGRCVRRRGGAGRRSGESPAVSTSEPLGRWEETRCRR